MISWDTNSKFENKGKKKNMKLHYLSFNVFINVLLDGNKKLYEVFLTPPLIRVQLQLSYPSEKKSI